MPLDTMEYLQIFYMLPVYHLETAALQLNDEEIDPHGSIANPQMVIAQDLGDIQDIQMVTPRDIQMVTPHDIQMVTPQDIQMVTPQVQDVLLINYWQIHPHY